jgi:hypothetical protein
MLETTGEPIEMEAEGGGFASEESEGGGFASEESEGGGFGPEEEGLLGMGCCGKQLGVAPVPPDRRVRKYRMTAEKQRQLQLQVALAKRKKMRQPGQRPQKGNRPMVAY